MHARLAKYVVVPLRRNIGHFIKAKSGLAASVSKGVCIHRVMNMILCIEILRDKGGLLSSYFSVSDRLAAFRMSRLRADFLMLAAIAPRMSCLRADILMLAAVAPRT